MSFQRVHPEENPGAPAGDAHKLTVYRTARASMLPGLFLESEEVSALTPPPPAHRGLSPRYSTDSEVCEYPKQFGGDSRCCLLSFLMSRNLICFVTQPSYMFN